MVRRTVPILVLIARSSVDGRPLRTTCGTDEQVICTGVDGAYMANRKLPGTTMVLDRTFCGLVKSGRFGGNLGGSVDCLSIDLFPLNLTRHLLCFSYAKGAINTQ